MADTLDTLDTNDRLNTSTRPTTNIRYVQGVGNSYELHKLQLDLRDLVDVVHEPKQNSDEEVNNILNYEFRLNKYYINNTFNSFTGNDWIYFESLPNIHKLVVYKYKLLFD
jgi:hypothetical protein